MEYAVNLYPEVEHIVDTGIDPEYRVKVYTEMAASLRAGFTNRLRASVQKFDNDASVSPALPNDVALFASLTNGSAAGVITGATAATPPVVTTAEAHGLVTGDKVVIRGVVGVYEANGKHTVTVLTTTTFSLDGIVGTGAYAALGTPQVFKCLSGLDAIAFTVVAGQPGQYTALLSTSIPITKGVDLQCFAWATGAYANKFLEQQSVRVV